MLCEIRQLSLQLGIVQDAWNVHKLTIHPHLLGLHTVPNNAAITFIHKPKQGAQFNIVIRHCKSQSTICESQLTIAWSNAQ